MKITAELNQLRMAPRKVRLVADAIRGKSYPEAELVLRFLTRHAAGPLEKLLKSAAANARQNFQVTEMSSLTVAEVRVDGGATLKRRRARARGRAFPIRKHTSRVILVLEAKGVPVRAPGRKAEIEVVRNFEKDEIKEADGSKPRHDRPLSPQSSKTDTKPTGFVQRMFRRKAI